MSGRRELTSTVCIDLSEKWLRRRETFSTRTLETPSDSIARPHAGRAELRGCGVGRGRRPRRPARRPRAASSRRRVAGSTNGSRAGWPASSRRRPWRRRAGRPPCSTWRLRGRVVAAGLGPERRPRLGRGPDRRRGRRARDLEDRRHGRVAPRRRPRRCPPPSRRAPRSTVSCSAATTRAAGRPTATGRGTSSGSCSSAPTTGRSPRPSARSSVAGVRRTARATSRTRPRTS